MKTKLWIYVTLAFFSGTSYSASFDCGKAKTKHETLICSNDQLNEVDGKLGIAYKEASGVFPVNGFLKLNQQAFLTQYRYCASEKDQAAAAKECIEVANRRIRELEGFKGAQIYTDAKASYSVEDMVLAVVNVKGVAYLKYFGAWVPDMNRQKPFPDGSICDGEIELKTVKGKLVPVDRELKIDISESQISVEEFFSCTPRNGFSGKFPRVIKK